jgi:hypothetical protein
LPEGAANSTADGLRTSTHARDFPQNAEGPGDGMHRPGEWPN